ncbi:hypothetical protein [Thermogemmatispora carboxidivorans]|uniref:hypothetical protein n=1 Tax=Thermogemmatispora carboxidivorans TaxID=1382306 RepID=UPI00069C8216|nr:hypothetical protein [Thermogemmatispora carboxidivorans]
MMIESMLPHELLGALEILAAQPRQDTPAFFWLRIDGTTLATLQRELQACCQRYRLPWLWLSGGAPGSGTILSPLGAGAVWRLIFGTGPFFIVLQVEVSEELHKAVSLLQQPGRILLILNTTSGNRKGEYDVRSGR